MTEIIKKIFGSSNEQQVESFDDSIADVTLVLGHYGIDSWSRNWKLKNTLKIIFPIIILSLYVTVFEYLYIRDYRDDVEIFVHSISPSFASELTFWKMLMIFWNRDLIRALINRIRNEFWNLNPDETLRRSVLLKGSRVMKRIIRFYVLLFGTSSVVYCIIPCFTAIFFSKATTPFKLPMPGLHDETWTIYSINYFVQILDIIVVGSINAVVDIFPFAFLMQCGIQVNYLIRLMTPLTTPDHGMDHLVSEIMREVYENHLKLKTFASDINKAFSVIIFMQLTHSACLICIAIYQYVTLPVEVRTIEPLFFSSCAISQLAVYCFSGQYLTNKFEELYETMAQVCWYQMNKDEKRSYLIMLANMQQPVIVRSDFNELSVAVFGNILNSAYSFYAILHKVTD